MPSATDEEMLRNTVTMTATARLEGGAVAVPDEGQVAVEVKLPSRRAFIELIDQKGWNVEDILVEPAERQRCRADLPFLRRWYFVL